jgi:UDP-GlcNAc3NAcA epimerase
MKIVTVIGARPQFVKAAAVSAEFRRAGVEEIIVHTGQHYDPLMSDIFFEELEIPKPQYHFQLGGGGHGAMTGSMLASVEEVLQAEKPDGLLVYGDTNSTIAGALAAAKLHIPVVHVEAGLRSYNRTMPEEVNRVLTDHISRLLFCPSEQSQKNLAAEGITEGVYVLGDVMADATRIYSKKASTIDFTKHEGEYALLTLHRAENTNDLDRLRWIYDELNSLTCKVVFPIHPRMKKLLYEHDMALGNHIQIVEPYGYLEMLYHLQNATFVVTDSGGLQKEAYWLKKPCITFRPETEWIETVNMGWNRLHNPGGDALVDVAKLEWVNDEWPTLYGDSYASKQLVKVLRETL